MEMVVAVREAGQSSVAVRQKRIQNICHICNCLNVSLEAITAVFDDTTIQ
jgi:hypothetical protein